MRRCAVAREHQCGCQSHRTCHSPCHTRCHKPSGATAEGDAAGRPASLAEMRLRSVADQVREELAGHRRRFEQLVDAALESFDEAGDLATVEVELANMEPR